MKKNDVNKLDQLKYVDNLLKIMGYKNIADYTTSINVNNIDDSIISSVNNTLNLFKQIFPTKSFNLSRINYKLVTNLQTLSFAKNCLNHIEQPYEIFRKNNKSFLRLKPLNNLLYNYINMEGYRDIVHNGLSYIGQQISKRTETCCGSSKVVTDGFIREFVKIEETIRIGKIDKLYLITDIVLIKSISLLNLPQGFVYGLYYNDILIERSNGMSLDFGHGDLFDVQVWDANMKPVYVSGTDDMIGRKDLYQTFTFNCFKQGLTELIVKNGCIDINLLKNNLYIDIIDKTIDNPIIKDGVFLVDEFKLQIIDSNNNVHMVNYKPNNMFKYNNLPIIVSSIQFPSCVDFYLHDNIMKNITEFNMNGGDGGDEKQLLNKYVNNKCQGEITFYLPNENTLWTSGIHNNKVFVQCYDPICEIMVTHYNFNHKMMENGKCMQQVLYYSY